MGDLREELQFLQQDHVEEAHKKKAEEALKRIEKWNLFSDAHDKQVCPFLFKLWRSHLEAGMCFVNL